MSNINELKEKNILLQIEAAKGHGKLVEGLANVWIASKGRREQLLVVEKQLLFEQIESHKLNELVADTFPKNKTLQAKDAIDEAVENVLKNGGDIEFVENGLLKKYKHLVIIEPY
jgi:hypothetical protein